MTGPYTIGRSWQTDLEPGWWFEICHGPRNLIAGFVWIPLEGDIQYRDVLGQLIPKTRIGNLPEEWNGAISAWLTTT